jgi:hypothetical protein
MKVLISNFLMNGASQYFIDLKIRRTFFLKE